MPTGLRCPRAPTSYLVSSPGFCHRVCGAPLSPLSHSLLSRLLELTSAARPVPRKELYVLRTSPHHGHLPLPRPFKYPYASPERNRSRNLPDECARRINFIGACGAPTCGEGKPHSPRH
ncbi:hypothetical protein C8R44DRAFT_863541 [Mycena epipterygia]|nr:hypothetical protein C8R44DRAFT_863541 [Mycena epipterygia]